MKKTLVTLMFFTGLSCVAFAQQPGFVPSNGQQGYSLGGFTGPASSVATSVAEAKKQWDDAWVALEGYITKQVGHELYEFRDNSGVIYVEIDGKYWMGQNVSPKDKVRIEGEVDKDWNSVEIDVKNIRVLK
ncbi:YgiW/YdeI family stress tolerance OB fold protein [Escherichia coli]|uniref:NirD/YgiW/YdeI family stress tolerance protein n=2 Tax=Escherichia coli TaxID=562 RepID=A0AAN5ZJP2_ECOLX|nr:YgiW/YdeI family stress tolerance OB fold protein [Escherichia coli]EEW2531607.1 NirD/YgiW/YdeI family stress tolerance protein [Escherichia coli]EFA3722661.1 NirD/YgiW/YdeI family stress tolerance protein [Escherichia coli]EFA5330361.1 NirD/YgiW/YdeI family stress tolerance protein [Escherichia coli]EFH1601341.1 NirD/YgiW/YdeI family stress tolerance protein [Escherichia coli]EFN4858813.1 NirD/YgiW/YdeI family stress tolerance protein [Escherichia coli]